jgi:hypothetical protein
MYDKSEWTQPMQHIDVGRRTAPWLRRLMKQANGVKEAEKNTQHSHRLYNKSRSALLNTVQIGGRSRIVHHPNHHTLSNVGEIIKNLSSQLRCSLIERMLTLGP